MAFRTLLVAVLLALVAGPAVARPVSYPGGWTVIEDTDRQSTALWIHYTPHQRYSLGVRSEWDRVDDLVFNGVQATGLAKRWNGRGHQANLYGFVAVGALEGVNGSPAQAHLAGMAGVVADWETRRWFLSYKARGQEAGALDASFSQAARVGVAPYVANTGALHTWLMVEFDHRPDADEPLGATPLVRFFKGPALLELGWSLTDDRPLANFAYRF